MEHAARAVTSSYNSFTNHASSATNVNAHQTGILATNAHFSSYYGTSGSRNGKPISIGRKPWVLPVIIVGAVVGAILLAAIVFFLFKRQRRGGSYRNLEKPTLGEHREVFDARISEALESDASEPLPTGQSGGDYAHPYGQIDTSYRGTSRANSPYRGPEKPFTDKSLDQGA